MSVTYGNIPLSAEVHALDSCEMSVVPFHYRLTDERAVEWVHVIARQETPDPISVDVVLAGQSLDPADRYHLTGIACRERGCLSSGAELGFACQVPAGFDRAWIEIRITGASHDIFHEIPIGQRASPGTGLLAAHNSNEVESAFWDPSSNDDSHRSIDGIGRLVLAEIERAPSLLQDMRSDVFERLVAELFRRYGYRVTLTAGTADGGVDILAVSPDDLSSTSHVIQCKRYKNKIGVEFVRELYAVKFDCHANKALLVTTSDFTRPAREFAQRYAWELQLVGGNDVVEWIRQRNQLDSMVIRQPGGLPSRPPT